MILFNKMYTVFETKAVKHSKRKKKKKEEKEIQKHNNLIFKKILN